MDYASASFTGLVERRRNVRRKSNSSPARNWRSSWNATQLARIDRVRADRLWIYTGTAGSKSAQSDEVDVAVRSSSSTKQRGGAMSTKYERNKS